MSGFSGGLYGTLSGVDCSPLDSVRVGTEVWLDSLGLVAAAVVFDGAAVVLGCRPTCIALCNGVLGIVPSATKSGGDTTVTLLLSSGLGD